MAHAALQKNQGRVPLAREGRSSREGKFRRSMDWRACAYRHVRNARRKMLHLASVLPV
jgi:hypothetical protein